jgi:hypothetical protein
MFRVNLNVDRFSCLVIIVCGASSRHFFAQRGLLSYVLYRWDGFYWAVLAADRRTERERRSTDILADSGMAFLRMYSW